MGNAILNTLFYFCNDVEPLRAFYIELLGMEETLYRNDDHAGWLTFLLEQVNVVFIRADAPVPAPDVFARQPGYPGGQLETHSWVLELPQLDFEAIVIRMQAARVPSLTPAPVEPRPGHRQFVVRDPMGHTIELISVVNS